MDKWGNRVTTLKSEGNFSFKKKNQSESFQRVAFLV